MARTAIATATLGPEFSLGNYSTLALTSTMLNQSLMHHNTNSAQAQVL